jgi:hypothetical protein
VKILDLEGHQDKTPKELLGKNKNELDQRIFDIFHY